MNFPKVTRDTDRVFIPGVVTSEKNPGDPEDDTSARRIKVLVLQASSTPTEKIYYTAQFPAVNTRDEPLLLVRPEDVKATQKYYQPDCGILPDVRRSPKTRQRCWSANSFKRRTICDLGDYHILHAPSTDKEMPQNWFRPNLFRGDIYVLDVSRTRSCTGACIYEDVLLNANQQEETAFMEMLDGLMKLKGEL